MKKRFIAVFMSYAIVAVSVTGCSGGNKAKENTAQVKTDDHTGSQPDTSPDVPNNHLITVGFAQAGIESDWRTANTASMNDTFREANGYALLLEDAGTDEKKQIEAVQSFVDDGVDYIIISLLGAKNGKDFVLANLGNNQDQSHQREQYEQSWETVLKAAHESSIPVILTGGMVNIKEDELYTAWVGSDYLQEGYDAASWLAEYAQKEKIKSLHILILEDEYGLESAKQRFTGFMEQMETETISWDIITKKDDYGDNPNLFSIEDLRNGKEIRQNYNVILCENDRTAMAAADYLEENNISLDDIVMITFGGSKQILQYMKQGKIESAVECTPLYADYVKTIMDQMQNEEYDKLCYVDEQVISAKEADALISERRY